MLNIEIGQEQIRAVGHAENKPICGMFSGMASCVLLGLQNAGEDDVMELVTGTMTVDKSKIKTETGRFLIVLLEDCIEELCDKYPNSFQIVTRRGCRKTHTEKVAGLTP